MNLTDALAAYRLTRLVTADTLLDGPRDAIVRGAYHRAGAYAGIDDPPGATWADVAMDDHAAPKLATLVTCRWCAGMWISLGVVVARRLCPKAWAPVATALSYSAGAALLARLED